MKRFTIFGCFVLTLAFALNAYAQYEGDRIYHHDGRAAGLLTGGPSNTAKASRDTARLIGPANLNPVVVGTFQDGSGLENWNGWTTKDWTVSDTTDQTWHVSDYYAIDGTYSAYCGDETMPSCGGGDPAGGYDSDFVVYLRWAGTVANNTLTTSLTVSFDYDVDSEPGYDWAVVARELENEGYEDIWWLSGDTTGSVSFPVTYASDEYFGDLLNEVALWFYGDSDGNTNDEDCWYPSNGLWRFDNCQITGDNGIAGFTEDFEDGTLDPFTRFYKTAVGDFTHLETGLGDPDLCQSNGSPQVTFIDDGVVHPATGGSFATADNRRYAFGYVVNYTGGLTFNDQNHLRNAAVSPVIPWQDPAHDGTFLELNWMLDTFVSEGETGILAEWLIRSTTGDEASIEDAGWIHSPYVYEGGPGYNRANWDATSRVVQGRTYIQLMIGCYEIAWLWGADGTNGSPSPYFDNVRLESFPYEGPAMTTLSLYLAQSRMPEIGIIDTADLGRNSIRFDRAENISPSADEWYHAGDSICIDVSAVRDGADLTARPNFHYKLQRNPLFDPYRTAGLPDSGVVVMDTTYNSSGFPIADRYKVDMPDTGWLFPGDILHYYFSAEDAIFPGGTEPFTSTLPDDLDGWGDFADPFAWSDVYTFRGLPTVVEDTGNPGEYICPPVLFWDDSESTRRGTDENYYGAWANLGLKAGEDYDIYYAQAPSSGVGNGISRAASTSQLGWYDELVYVTCYLSSTTISNGDWDNGGDDDITRLSNWLDLGDKDIFFTGNDLCYDMFRAGAPGQGFLNNVMGLTFDSKEHVDLLGGQLSPRVLATPSNPVLATLGSWISDGGCPTLWDFDLVRPNGSTRLAVFANAAGVDGGYPYSPLSLMEHASGSRVITSTTDLSYIMTDPNEGSKADASLSARARLLKDVLAYFGVDSKPGQATGVPATGKFMVRNAPNPFNPKTFISYTIKAPGHMTLKIFNVRGELVQTLIDGHVEADGMVEWDGTNSQGGKVSSGVYFYQAQMGGDVQVSKMALVK